MKLVTFCCSTVAGLLMWSARLEAQPAITADDFFNQAGQYFRGYASAKDAVTDVRALVGRSSPVAQTWDFTLGPTEVIYRFDYLRAASVPAATNFPGATLVEVRTDEAQLSTPLWRFFTQDPSAGQLEWGFYDGLTELMVAGTRLGIEPAGQVYENPLRRFPASIRFGDEWSATAAFTNRVWGIGNRVAQEEDEHVESSEIEFTLSTSYRYTAKADAFGVVKSPGMDAGECLRINELAELSQAYSGMAVFTNYVRTCYWLRPGRGVVAQVTSTPYWPTEYRPVPPPDIGDASLVLRMFETNHPDPLPSLPEHIEGLDVKLTSEGALLTWNPAPGVTSYRVDYAEALTPADGWKTLQEPSPEAFALDAAGNATKHPSRYYRVVGFR